MNLRITNLNVHLHFYGPIPSANAVNEYSATEQSKGEYYTDKSATDGVYFCTTNGHLWDASRFEECKKAETIKGVAIVKGEHRFIVSPKGSKNMILLDGDKTLPGAIYEDYQQALKDNEGYANTRKLLELGSPAAEFCKSLGEEWYLPTMSEMQLMCEHKADLDECLSKIGEKMPDEWHWTSTRISERCHFAFYWVDGYRDCSVQSSIFRVRPVSALSPSL
ncbi:hypothetical protein [Bacteroides reticulotermitis]|uniref:DUF1566 domain-containing protein n=2 Tax=Bacteroides reticulotermitis TaxID=1133319 RepID=W4URG7_9BACE|nr:hypothetical protein [Bacteroides reticulotermitis]MBB4043872.1 hypothetical protein [Bacteroides reticulotermitis]GAE83382.1 hypothetical protein JCM10512_1650 [Bacteroides reticulotermitis JCM 10512]